ncbi:MAG: flagellar hook-length control protein FliK [Spirochaetales bacterium]|nr:flagellar hook-length control protein FliK [Spirochaetales bacterium]
MRMISMTNSTGMKTEGLDSRKNLQNERVDNKSFKTELDNKSKISNSQKIEEKNNSKKVVVENAPNNIKKESKDLALSSEVQKKPDIHLESTLSLKNNSKTELGRDIKSKLKSNSKTDSNEKLNSSEKDSANQVQLIMHNTNPHTIDKKETAQAQIDKISEKKSDIGSNEKISKDLTSSITKTSANIHSQTNLENKVSNKNEKKSDNNITKVKDLRNSKLNENIVNPEKASVKTQEIVKNNSDEVLKIETEGESIILGSKDISFEGDNSKPQAPVTKEFSTLLKEQLRDFGNNEIVKQSRFILKDNNIGEIKLILKPESLGQVKINLNLNENSLAGQIVVENNSVKEIFQENMASLTRALEKEGYDSAKLELSLSDKDSSRNRDDSKNNKQYFSERLKRFNDNGQVVRYGLPTAGINLTA